MSMADVYLSQFESMSNFIGNQVVDLPEDVFHRRPGSSLNPISFSYFHLLRVWDVDLNWIVKGLAPKNDAWHRGGFSEKSGYSPDGKGVRGMGIGTGFTDEDVDAMNVSRALLQEYQQQLMDETEAYLNGASDDELNREVAPLPNAPDRPATCAQRLQHAMNHALSHAGELRFAKGMIGMHDPTYPGASS
ncbi:MAG TPA: DinB family protein [Nitrolancea sp.]